MTQMKIEVDKTYIARSGTRVKIVRYDGGVQPMVGIIDGNGRAELRYYEDGCYFKDRSPSPLDLVMAMVTPWFPPYIKPVGYGWYDTKRGNGYQVQRRYWGGAWSSEHNVNVRDSIQSWYWRGLATPPAAEKPARMTKHQKLVAVAKAGNEARRDREPVAWRFKERINEEFDSDWILTKYEPADGVRIIAKEPLYTAAGVLASPNDQPKGGA